MALDEPEGEGVAGQVAGAPRPRDAAGSSNGVALPVGTGVVAGSGLRRSPATPAAAQPAGPDRPAGLGD
eukprot:10091430-Lingulodinium_polyedra.AAC.1